jgi:hypothetical protein
VKAWLGYAEIFFLGFGPEGSLASPVPTAARNRPKYQISSECASWLLERDGTAVCDIEEEYSVVLEAIRRLIGMKATAWEFVGSQPGLRILFQDKWSLTVTPFAGREFEDRWAWSLRMPDGWVTLVSCGGTIITQHENEPYYP